MKILTVLCFIMVLALPPTFGDIVGQWTFDDQTLNDTSANPAPTGTFVGDVSWVNDPDRGWVISPAGGEANYVDLSNAAKLAVTDEVTISTWFKVTADFTGSILSVGRTGDYGVSLNSSVAVPVFWFHLNVPVPDPCAYYIVLPLIDLNDGNWHNITGTYSKSRGKMALYLDFVENNFPPVWNPPEGNSISLTPDSNTFAGKSFNGLIDDITIYNEALTSAQVAALAPQNLKMEWLFNGNANDTSNYTAVGTPMNGTLHTGATLVTDGCYEVASLTGEPNCHISMPYQPKMGAGTSITVMGWVKPGADVVSPTVWPTVLGGGSPYYQVVWSGSSFLFYIISYGDGEGFAAGSGTPFVWQHFAGTYDGSKIRVYINGVFASDGNKTEPCWQDPVPFAIGGLYRATDNAGNQVPGGYFIKTTPTIDGSEFKGSVEDVRLFNQVLDVDAINYYMMLDRNPLITMTICGPQWLQLPDNTVQVSGDANNPNPGGSYTLLWTKDSGPGTVTFDPNATVKNPVATFSAAGDYVLRLTASIVPSGCDNPYRTVKVKVYSTDLGPMIAHYTFDNGDANDSSGYTPKLDGVLQGAATIVNDPNGIHGKVLRCSTSGSIEGWVNCGIANRIKNIERSMTAAAWVKTTAASGTATSAWQGIVGRGFTSWGWRLLRKYNYVAAFETQLAGDIGDGRWHHVALTFNSGEARCVYIDGVLASNIPLGSSARLTPPTTDPNAEPLVIAVNASTPTKYFSGYIDDVRVYEQALTASQVAALVPKGDLSTDSKVNFKDMAILASNWQIDGTAACVLRVDKPLGYNGYAYLLGDYNRDCKVDVKDVITLAEMWLTTATEP